MFRRGYGWMGRGWDPFQEMDRFRREMNRLFENWEPAARTAHGYPAANVWIGENEVVVTAELPGIDPADVSISVHGETLTIKGNRKADELKEGETYHRRERGQGSFTRTLELPFRVESDKVDATFKDGVLKVTLPRAEADRPRRIAVKAA